MSESFYVLLGHAHSHFPPTEVVQEFVDKMSMMDAAAIHKKLVRFPLVNSSLPMIRGFVMDMTREEIAKELISCLDIHYHDLLEKIDHDDHKRSLFRGTMSLILDDLTYGEAAQ
jgi:hypothetical protein